MVHSERRAFNPRSLTTTGNPGKISAETHAETVRLSQSQRERRGWGRMFYRQWGSLM